jgi:hypothetical protein
VWFEERRKPLGSAAHLCQYQRQDIVFKGNSTIDDLEGIIPDNRNVGNEIVDTTTGGPHIDLDFTPAIINRNFDGIRNHLPNP